MKQARIDQLLLRIQQLEEETRPLEHELDEARTELMKLSYVAPKPGTLAYAMEQSLYRSLFESMAHSPSLALFGPKQR